LLITLKTTIKKILIRDIKASTRFKRDKTKIYVFRGKKKLKLGLEKFKTHDVCLKENFSY
jgi:hypothetical protein